MEKNIENKTSTREYGPQHAMFVRELLSIAGVSSLEELQNQDLSITHPLRPVGSTPLTDPLEEKAGIQIEDEGERCQLCHTAIKNSRHLRINGKVIDQFSIGMDCAQKIIQFTELGIIDRVTSQKTRESIFRDTLFSSLKEYDHAELDNEENNSKKKVTKRAIVASMLTWLDIYFEHHKEVENETLAAAVYNIIHNDYYPDTVTAQDIVTFYDKVRTYNVGMTLTGEEQQGYFTHPHKKLLEKVFSKRRTKEEVERIRSLIDKGVQRNREKEAKRWKDNDIEIARQEEYRVIALQEAERIRSLLSKNTQGSQERGIAESGEVRPQRAQQEGLRRIAALETGQKRLEKLEVGNLKIKELIQSGAVINLSNRTTPNHAIQKVYEDEFATPGQIHTLFFEDESASGTTTRSYFLNERTEGVTTDFGIITGKAQAAAEQGHTMDFIFCTYLPLLQDGENVYVIEKDGALTQVETYLKETDWESVTSE